MTPTQVINSAKAVIDLANQIKSAYVLAKEYSDYNSVTDPGWGSLQANNPGIDANGLVSGTSSTPQDISNAIGSINMFINYWSGNPVATSAWGQNLQKLSNPIV